MEQWKVVSDESSEISDNIKHSKREYGLEKKEIKESDDGWVYLLYREDVDAEWIVQQEFIKGNPEIPYEELGIDDPHADEVEVE